MITNEKPFIKPKDGILNIDELIADLQALKAQGHQAVALTEQKVNHNYNGGGYDFIKVLKVVDLPKTKKTATKKHAGYKVLKVV